MKNDPNYDKSDSDDEDDNGVAKKLSTFTPSPSSHLPNDDDIDLASPGLEETVADKPLPKRKVTAMTPINDAGSEQEDEGKSFELASWV